MAIYYELCCTPDDLALIDGIQEGDALQLHIQITSTKFAGMSGDEGTYGNSDVTTFGCFGSGSGIRPGAGGLLTGSHVAGGPGGGPGPGPGAGGIGDPVLPDTHAVLRD